MLSFIRKYLILPGKAISFDSGAIFSTSSVNVVFVNHSWPSYVGDMCSNVSWLRILTFEYWKVKCVYRRSHFEKRKLDLLTTITNVFYMKIFLGKSSTPFYLLIRYCLLFTLTTMLFEFCHLFLHDLFFDFLSHFLIEIYCCIKDF